MSKVCMVTQVRNEAKRLPEWVEYHKKLGVDEIFIFDDRSTDNTPSVIQSCGLNLLEGFTDGYYIDSSNPDEYHTSINVTFHFRQIKNYTLGCLKSAELGFDWTFVQDVDEFLCLSNHTTIQDYLKDIENKHPDMNRLHIPSYDFNTQIIDNESDKMTERFLHRWSDETRQSVGNPPGLFRMRHKSAIKRLQAPVSCPHYLDYSPCLDTGPELKLFQYRFPPLTPDGFVEKDEHMLKFWKRKS